jgi:hypothetical protein
VSNYQFADEVEVCSGCGDTLEDCMDAGECNYGIIGYEDDTCASCNGSCHCDADNDSYKDSLLDDEER